MAGVSPGTLSSRGPWLACRLCCPAGSSLTMASSETLAATERLICFVRPALRRRVVPQFNLHVFSCMPSSGPRWTGREHTTVTSPDRAGLRHLCSGSTSTVPRSLVLTRTASRGWIRFACATACTIASPSPTRTFTTELSPDGSPRTDVGYNYLGKQSIPRTGLTPAKHAALWAASKDRRNTLAECRGYLGIGGRIPVFRYVFSASTMVWMG